MKRIEQLLFSLSEAISQKSVVMTEKEVAYCWIHATDNLEQFYHCTSVCIRKSCFKQKAYGYYEKWFSQDEDIKYRSGYISSPNYGESLMSYLRELSIDACKCSDKKSNWWKSFRSFLRFLRLHLHPTDFGDLYTLFPKEMEVVNGNAVRMVQDYDYPLDVIAHSKIIKAAVDKILNGPKQGRRSAVELLALILVQLAFSWLRLSVNAKVFRELTLESMGENFDPESGGTTTLTVLSEHGLVEFPISNWLKEFLVAIAQINNDNNIIFQCSLRRLQSTLQGVVRSIPEVSRLGPIAITTFLQCPHEAIGHRYQRKT